MSMVKVEERDRVAIITIDSPKNLNALSAEMLLELQQAWISLDNTSVAVLTGSGKAFVAGGDIKSMVNFSSMQARSFVELGQGVMRTIEESPFISIAAINGFALGGGLELAMACDLIYAGKQAKLGLPETNLGIIPGFGGTKNLLHRVGFHRSMEMILSGRTMSADDAEKLGLVLQVFEDAELLPRCLEMAERFAKKGRYSMLAARRLIRSHALLEHEKAYLLERETFATLFSSGEPKEGMSAFLEKREAKFS